jgi:hypothetical protein
MLRTLTASILTLAVLFAPAFSKAAAGQSTAINGTIEGTVKDEQGALLPGVTVTVVNLDTGDQRVVVTNESGLYRAPLLSLGTYRVIAELQGFKKFEQTGVSLRAGQTAVIDVALSVGALAETITVTADAPLVDLAKIEQGRTLSEAEIKTLPLTSRNPYNFALLQPGVVGFETNEFGVPRITANGALLRVNYQVDGSNNTQKDRAGLRQMPMSEVMIREVTVVTSGYAPEFGQTMGLVYNAITPSGTNTLKGQGSYRMQRQSMVEKPFFTAAGAAKPPTDVNVFTVDLGGPIVRDKTHFFGGYEHTERDLSGLSVITITPANQALLGLTEPAYMPRGLNTEFAIGKVDHQLSAGNRLSVRYMFFDNFITANVGGGNVSVQRANDFADRQHSTGAQLITTLGASMLNEFRLQYATRAQSRVPNALSGTGPAINITGVANIGGPIATVSDSGFGFTQNVLQVNNNFTVLRGNHAIKAGVDLQWVKDTRVAAPAQLYTFPNAAAYLAARSGENRFGYTSFTQYFGLPNLEYDTAQSGFFIQDDWRATPDLKILYGVRYDLYAPPDGAANAPLVTSREFPTATSNVAPRLGAVWTLGERRRTVLRANTGLMYDQTLNAIYEQALQNDGTNARASATFTPTQVGVNGGAQRRSRRAAEPGLDGRSRLQDRAVVAEQPAVRARHRRPLLDGRRHVVRPRLQPPGRHQHQPDQPDRRAGRRPPDLQHRRQRDHPPRSALQRHQQRAVAGRVDLPQHDAAADAPPAPRHRLRPGLHAGQGRGQRPDHRRAVGAGRRRPLRHDQPRVRSRPQHPRPAPHLRRQHRRHAAVRARRRRRCNPQQQRVRCRRPAGQRHPRQPAQQPRAQQRRHRQRSPAQRPAQLAQPAGAQERRLPLLAPAPHPGQHGGGDHRGGEERVQHRAGLQRQRDGPHQRAGRADGDGADQRRSAAADRRLRAAAVSARLQVRVLKRKANIGDRRVRDLEIVGRLPIDDCVNQSINR